VTADSPVARLVIVLERAATAADLANPLNYAATAAAMDVAVELHVAGTGIALFRQGALTGEAGVRLRQAVELGVKIFACPAALAGQGMAASDLAPEVAGLRGAASLIAAGMAPGARFMVF
jgi:predicted peroxiredoxin